ncbi:MAG TPA: tRNA (adenosine(37)-N6)-threonylcarbamoyltransferase complex dimerization subunit type 1 TsaB [Bryobacteraceae bacterium]|nr:tRNA (adenosine(37)-N6)-threonylcarbamoyltransferase complex dimerization subunit type 1 TsaB [Bryobacteraceae bacterium]
MTILAVDTTSNLASVAIRRKGETVSTVTLESAGGFAHLLFGLIGKCRNEAKIDLEEVDCFAAAAGPGSFTGVRVGLTAVKGLGEALAKPVSGISNLRALASFGKNAGLRAVILDARRSEVYTAVYDAGLRLATEETVGPLEEFLAALGSARQHEIIHGTNQPLAPAVALCAELDGQGKWLDPAVLDANYVRRSDAELHWREA